MDTCVSNFMMMYEYVYTYKCTSTIPPLELACTVGVFLALGALVAPAVYNFLTLGALVASAVEVFLALGALIAPVVGVFLALGALIAPTVFLALEALIPLGGNPH